MARRRPRADGSRKPAELRALGSGRFELAGELGFDEAPGMLAEGDAAFGSLQDAEVDLGKLSRVDSAGLAVLIEWSIAARGAGRSLAYRNIPAAVTALAGISEVSEMLASGGGGSA